MTPLSPPPSLSPAAAHQHDAEVRRDRRRAWAVMGVTAMGAASIGVSIGALGPCLPLLQTHLRTPLDQLGLLFAANFGGSVVATLLVGPLVDRRPARPLMVAGVMLTLAGQVLLALATSLPQAIAALLLTGLGVGTDNLGVAVLAARFFGAQGGRALSLINMAFGVGAFAGPLIAATVLGALHDYRAIFAGVAVSLVAPLALYSVLPLAGPPVAAPHTEGEQRPRAGLMAIGLLAAVASLYLGTEIGFGGWVFTYVRQTTTADVATASWVVSAYWLALSVGSLGAAVRPSRVGADPLILACAAGATLAALAVVGGHGHPGLEIAAAFAVGLLLGPIYPLTLANAAGLVPTAAGRVGAAVIAISQCGGGILPWLQGLLFASGPSWGISMSALLCLGMTALQLAYMRARRFGRPMPFRG